MANKEDNLIPFTEMSPSRHSELSRKGQKASVIAKKEKATLRNTIKWLLEESDIRITKGPIYDMYKQQGIDISKLTPGQLATIGLWAGAVTNKAENYKTLMAGNGELAEIETEEETPSVEYKVMDTTESEKEFWNDEKN